MCFCAFILHWSAHLASLAIMHRDAWSVARGSRTTLLWVSNMIRRVVVHTLPCKCIAMLCLSFATATQHSAGRNSRSATFSADQLNIVGRELYIWSMTNFPWPMALSLGRWTLRKSPSWLRSVTEVGTVLKGTEQCKQTQHVTWRWISERSRPSTHASLFPRLFLLLS